MSAHGTAALCSLAATPRHACGGRSPDALQQRFVQRFESLEDWEQAMVVASLERVAAMLDADEIDASPVLSVGEIVSQPKA